MKNVTSKLETSHPAIESNSHLLTNGLIRSKQIRGQARGLIEEMIRELDAVSCVPAFGRKARSPSCEHTYVSASALQLHHVVADITGATGLRIIGAILADEHDPKVLARLRDYRCHASAETIEKALTGSYRAEHLFALEQALALYDAYHEKVSACDARIEAVLKGLSISVVADQSRCCPHAGREPFK